MEGSVSIEKRAANIKLLLMDCDGVLTDGSILLLPEGDDQKFFNVRDGLGLELLHRAGIKSGIISGRKSNALTQRARGLGVTYIRQGCKDKTVALREIIADARVTPAEIAYIGDDLVDIPLLAHAGLSIAVADAVAEVKARAHHITSAVGGRGAVREVIELILKAQGRWDDLVKPYLADR
jgi:3-deoxy-D-manno-octulosonate 8-phosphate phosphatase (KDO 8-P phosphatase)